MSISKNTPYVILLYCYIVTLTRFKEKLKCKELRITGDTIELPELAIRYVSPKDATPRKSGHQRVYNPNDMKFSIWENKNKSKENESNARNKTIRKKEGKES